MCPAPAILVCDDSRSILQAVSMILRLAGYRVLETSDAIEAVGLARREHPAVILMDVMMPGLSGDVAAGVLHDEPDLSTIPVVLLSALPEDELREHVRSTGAAGYITKPFRKDDLLKCISRWAPPAKAG
ncbi:MAG TPA: response regulator [Planctomycetota bacterium]|nr:response regulator [Planctomycetota bacterium]